MSQIICFEAFPKCGKLEDMRRILVGKHDFIEKQNQNGSYFYIEVPSEDAWMTKTMLRARRYRFRKYDKRYARGTSYRRDFFSTHKGPYRCAYCGKKLKSNELEVDHLIPVGKAKTESGVRALLQICGISNVNDPKNLVAACHECNNRKSDKMGVWVIKGAIGRHKSVWIIRNIIRFVLIVLICYFVFVKFSLWTHVRELI